VKRLAFFLELILLFGVAIGHAAAQGSDPPPTPSPDQVNAIARNLYCPVCANVPLDACGTAACAQWRQQIADLLMQGKSAQQIYDYFAAQYGPSVLAAPPARGLNLLVYILPPLGVLSAAALLWRAFAAWKRKTPARVKVGARPANKYSRELEKELKTRR
jgi:cytochrome c-type biogenesis protein CcmH